jgi:hypothetical protein
VTLNTQIWLHGPIHGRTAFNLSLTALLTAANRADQIATAQISEQRAGEVPDWVLDRDPAPTQEQIDYWRHDYDKIGTVLGQGLPGIVDCEYRDGGSPLATEDVYEDEDEGEEPYITQRKSQVELSWDTAYGYNENGLSCSMLHAKALILLYESLPDRITLTWQNEYTGDIFEGLNGLDRLLDNGDKAADWFENLVKPALEAEHPGIQWTTDIRRQIEN